MGTMIETMSSRFKGIKNWQLAQTLVFRMSIAMQIEFHWLQTGHS